MTTMTQDQWEKSVQWIGIVAGCVIKQDGKYLLVQEKQQKAYGLWNVPAGYVDKGEAIEHAAIREVKEETGFIVELDGLVGMYHENATRPLKYAYRARITGGELKAEPDEILDVKWLTFDEVTELSETKKLRADWVFDAISRVEAEHELLEDRV